MELIPGYRQMTREGKMTTIPSDQIGWITLCFHLKPEIPGIIFMLFALKMLSKEWFRFFVYILAFRNQLLSPVEHTFIYAQTQSSFYTSCRVWVCQSLLNFVSQWLPW